MRRKSGSRRTRRQRMCCVLNYEDEETRAFGEKRARRFYISAAGVTEKGVYLEDGNIICDIDEKIPVCSVDELNILGTHNHENAMAAVAMAYAYGTPMEIIREDAEGVPGRGAPDRIVAEEERCAYYNDSKGTNPDAAIRGIQARTVLRS